MSILHYCDIQCTAVLYSDWSLKMGQMGPKMALGTLMGMTFQAFKGLRGSNSDHDLISDIYRRHNDTMLTKGGRRCGNGWSKSFF